MIKAAFWLIIALLWSACATLDFVEGDVISGVFNSLLAITSAALSLLAAREGR
jgi:hypothetical protein